MGRGFGILDFKVPAVVRSGKLMSVDARLLDLCWVLGSGSLYSFGMASAESRHSIGRHDACSIEAEIDEDFGRCCC